MRIDLWHRVRRTRAAFAFALVAGAAALASGCAAGSTRGEANPADPPRAYDTIRMALAIDSAQPAGATGGETGVNDAVAALGRGGSATVARGDETSLVTGARRTVAQRGVAALASLAFPYRDLGYRVVFAPGRAGELGVINSRERRITIFVRAGQSDLSLRATVAHELGHALDFSYGSTDGHRRYREIRGLARGQWYPCNRCDDLASPAGDFAEVFAASLVGTGDFRSQLAGPPSPRQLRALASLLSIPRASAHKGNKAEERPAEPEPDGEPGQGLPFGLPGG